MLTFTFYINQFVLISVAVTKQLPSSVVLAKQSFFHDVLVVQFKFQFQSLRCDQLTAGP